MMAKRKKKDITTNNDLLSNTQKTQDWATRTSLKTGGELVYSDRVSSSWLTSDTVYQRRIDNTMAKNKKRQNAKQRSTTLHWLFIWVDRDRSLSFTLQERSERRTFLKIDLNHNKIYLNNLHCRWDDTNTLTRLYCNLFTYWHLYIKLYCWVVNKNVTKLSLANIMIKWSSARLQKNNWNCYCCSDEVFLWPIVILHVSRGSI